ncbi:[citrate (pro-3S)-lyase] ligase [Klebsiella aerogenes]|uniref:[citrate (pro-3S)-lyase] ligase n=1 Tax=Klebsiella aerogenes TaxID=548 RepID=UPI0034E41F16
MFDSQCIDLRTVDVSRRPASLAAIQALLAANQLVMDSGVTLFVTAWAGDALVGCAGLAANVIKCVAIDDRWRGLNLSARLLSEVQNLALEKGHFHLFLYTRPCNGERFRQCGFWPVAQTKNVLLMENTPRGISQYCAGQAKRRKPGATIGAVVMNANPFTLGHRYLAEQAANRCDWLHLFVVREEASFFPFRERLAMVREGVSHLQNVTVHEGGEYVISRATFPSYFLKASGLVETAWCELDLQIFRQHIAPVLGITHRFVGSEPFCPVTRQYNEAMRRCLSMPSNPWLPPIQVEELPRKARRNGPPISASEVRRLVDKHQFAMIREMVPETTYHHLADNYFAATA